MATVDEAHTRDTHRLFCLYGVTSPEKLDALAGRSPVDVLALGRFRGHFLSGRGALPQVLAFQEHDPAVLELPGEQVFDVVALRSAMLVVPESGLVAMLIVDVRHPVATLYELLAVTCFDREQVRIGGLPIVPAVVQSASPRTRVLLSGCRLDRDVHQVMAVARDQAVALYDAGSPYELKPDLRVLLPLIYRADSGHRFDRHNTKFPAELNRPTGGIAAHGRGVTVLAGAAEHVEHAVVLTAAQLIAALARLRAVKVRTMEALRIVRTYEATPLTLHDRRVAVSRLLGELSSLELELSFGVETHLDSVLVPEIVLDSYRYSLAGTLGIGGGTAATSQMVARLSAAVRAQDARLATEERSRSERVKARSSAVIAYITTIAVPLSLIFGFFSVATTEVRQGTSMLDVGTYAGFYVFVTVLLALGGLVWLAGTVVDRRTFGRPERNVEDRCDISAHRGGGEGEEQGRLEAYEQAAGLGVEYAEFDVRRTSDGELVVFHDEIGDVTLDELRAKAGYHVPTVGEAVAALKGSCICQVDLKERGYEDEVVAFMVDQVGVDGFVVTTLEDDSVRHIKRGWPEVRVGLSLGRDMANADPLTTLQVRLSELFPRRRIQRSRADFISVHQRLAVLTGLRWCSRLGIKAFVWTVNDTKSMARFLRDDRVECLITDLPQQARSIRAAAHL